jgi:hypothetical protein
MFDMLSRDLAPLRRVLSSPRLRRTTRVATPRGDLRTLKSTPYPAAVGRAFLEVARRRVAEWDHSLRRLEEVQMEQLQRIVTLCGESEYGRQHGLQYVRTYDEYRRSVPVADYDALAPLLERTRHGEQRLLTTENIEFICNSAGSSSKGKAKFLPVSSTQIRFQQGSASDAVLRHVAWTEDATLPCGFTMTVLPPTVMRDEGPMRITNNPALMSTRLPLFSEPVVLPDRDVMMIDDLDAKMDAIAERYLDHDIRTVTGTTCWFSILFDKLLAAARRQGRQVDAISEIWPNLKFLVGGGVAAGPYIDVIRNRMGSDAALIDTYNATEGGIFAVSDHAARKDDLLAIPDRGVFFEFVPLEDKDSDSPRRHPMWEVQTGVDYIIHVSTVSGLQCYRLGDIVRFTQLWPHRMVFSGRLSGCLSTTQELTTHREVQLAVDAALQAVPAQTVDYTVGAEIGVEGTAKARYVVFAEFVPDHRPADPQRFADAFDEAHRAQNRVYREHRQGDTAILSARLVELPSGSVQRFMQEEGMTSVQTKFPRIVDEARRDRLLGYAR